MTGLTEIATGIEITIVIETGAEHLVLREGIESEVGLMKVPLETSAVGNGQEFRGFPMPRRFHAKSCFSILPKGMSCPHKYSML